MKGAPGEFERAAREYMAVDRPLAALQTVSGAAENISPDMLFEILDKSLPQVAEASKSAGMELAYELQAIFEKLSVQPGINELGLAQRELAYLPLLVNHRGGLTLPRIMAKDPSFFVSVLCAVFKPSSRDEVEAPSDAKVKAEYAYQLLSNFTLVPGFGRGVESVSLGDWVSNVRRIAKAEDRERIGDQYVGHILSHAPADPEDHAWPHKRVREVLESEHSEELEQGVSIGRFNMGGAHAIDPRNPAALERHLAAQAREWASTASRWPRTSAMLNRMAEHWESFASVLEQRARQDELRDG